MLHQRVDEAMTTIQYSASALGLVGAMPQWAWSY
jgi:hypothetical protein